MTPASLNDFREVWCVDFEFGAPPGERPNPRCLVAQELDLYVEFRNRTNGLQLLCGAGLLGALAYFGLDGIDVTEKEEMRQLALRGGPWTDDEREALLAYCETDVVALIKLLTRMLPKLDLPRALLRGRYMAAAARIEHTGISIDMHSLATLRENWESIKEELIARIDKNYGVFEGRTFKTDRWAQWLADQNIPWPRLPSGNLALDDDTFKQMARSYPKVAPIRELRSSLSQMRLADLAVGSDGRNRCLLSAFRARTGRNQPSNSKFIFGPAVWLRSLIRPQPGYGLAYIDWSQQEFGIAATLSGDPAMIAAYESGDPYLAFAKQAGVIPPDGTKGTHGWIREQYKACVLAVQYGMGAEALAVRVGKSIAHAQELLRKHKETYPQFWRWSDAAVDHAMLHGHLYTVFGWTIRVGGQVNPRSLRNFPMQANGAEMLRLACCFATESDIRVCAPVHDAVLIEAPLAELDKAIALTQEAMADASAAVLGGFRLRSDVKVFRYPHRYWDERGEGMWNEVWDLIQERTSVKVKTVDPSIMKSNTYTPTTLMRV